MRPRSRLPRIAEDLGLITPEVEALREEWGMPACVCCNSFRTGPRPLLPTTTSQTPLAYTGTRNDTTHGCTPRLPSPKENSCTGYVVRATTSPGTNCAWRGVPRDYALARCKTFSWVRSA